jgi:hypothetical protein
MPNAAGGSIASRQLPLDYYLEIGVLLWQIHRAMPTFIFKNAQFFLKYVTERFYVNYKMEPEWKFKYYPAETFQRRFMERYHFLTPVNSS